MCIRDSDARVYLVGKWHQMTKLPAVKYELIEPNMKTTSWAHLYQDRKSLYDGKGNRADLRDKVASNIRMDAKLHQDRNEGK